MTALSALSVRAWDTRAHVTLLTDQRTQDALKTSGESIAVDAVILVDTPDVEVRLRSRYLKTCMRDAMDGDFLFLDSDTIVCGDLSPLAEIEADLAAVADQHRITPCLPELEEYIYGACGWNRPRRINLNSGVLYWRDTLEARELAQLWREKWQMSHAITGRHNDQQALNSALEDSGASFSELPGAYNAQVSLRPHFAFDARVWHIFSSDRDRVPTMRTVFDPYWDGGLPPDPADLGPLFRRSHPFAVDGAMDAYVVSLLVRNRDNNLPFNDWRRLWLAGRRVDSFKALVRFVRNELMKYARGWRRFGVRMEGHQ